MQRSRRSFLVWLVCSLSLAWLGAAGVRLVRRRGTRLEGALGEVLGRLSSDPRSARAIGAAYLSEHPQLDVARLQRSLAASGGSARDSSLEALAARTRRDFDEGRILEVGGWQLSQTEVYLCALVALAHSGRGDSGSRCRRLGPPGAGDQSVRARGG